MQSMWSAQQIRGAREYQEDFFAIIENNSIYFKGERFLLEDNTFPSHLSLYLLADGMGGMGHGDVAAEKALEAFINHFLNLCHQDISINDKFQCALEAANQSITDHVQKDSTLLGMGCTFVAVLSDSKDGSINWISVGDSPFWLLRNDNLQRLNEIHTLNELKDPQKFIADNTLSAEQQAVMGHYLASALTGEKLEYVDNPKAAVKLKHADVLILASDGLETLPNYTISGITTPIVDKIKQAKDNKHVFDLTNQIRISLVEAINNCGHADQDNTTVITITNFYDDFFENN